MNGSLSRVHLTVLRSLKQETLHLLVEDPYLTDQQLLFFCDFYRLGLTKVFGPDSMKKNYDIVKLSHTLTVTIKLEFDIAYINCSITSFKR